MIIRLLCIPATSASAERMFSVAGRLIEGRYSMKPNLVEDIMFLKTRLLRINYEDDEDSEDSEDSKNSEDA